VTTTEKVYHVFREMEIEGENGPVLAAKEPKVTE
jgi:hypothetical protein